MRLRPEDTFLTIALSVIGVAAVAGYLAIIAPTYDKEDRIPTPEEFALTVRAAAAETEAPVDTLYSIPETEKTAPEPEPPAPPAETEPEAETEAAPETEPSDPAETTLEEWFALVEARISTPREPTVREIPEPEPEVEEVPEINADTEAAPETVPELEPEPEQPEGSEPGTPEWNQAFIEENKYAIITAAKMTMDDSGEEYEIPSLAPQRWTLVMFDDSAVAASTDITFRGKNGTYLFVGEPVFNDEGKMAGTTNHYVEACGIILYTDGYCNDVFDTMRGWFGNPGEINGLFVTEGYDPDGTYIAASVSGEEIEVYWMSNRGQTALLYWAGSFTQPSGEEEYTFDSVNDTSKTENALFASNDPTKPMTVKNGTISFSATFQGVTKEFRLIPLGT